MRRSLARFANLFRRRRAEREMTREIEAHLALLREGFEQRGLSPQKAAREARLAYGGVDSAKELHRETRSFVFVEQFVSDLRYAARNLFRNRGFTAVAVAALAIGLGANASVFAIYNAVALKPLPVADPDRVVRLKRWFARSAQGPNQFLFSDAEYRYLRAHSTVFSGLVAVDGGADEDGGLSVLARIGVAMAQEHLDGRAVSDGYFDVLGVPIRLGRGFAAEEDRAHNGSRVLVLTDSFWERRFERDPQVIGQTIQMNGFPYVVIGVAPPKFTGTDLFATRFDFWIPLSMVPEFDPPAHPESPDAAFSAGAHTLHLLARLRPGVTRAQAQAQTGLLLRRYLTPLREKTPTTAVTLQRTSYNSDPDSLGGFSGELIAGAIVLSLLLIVACANVANMLLARGASRQREIAIRLALGCGRARVIRQLLAESVTLAMLGGALAIPMASIAGHWMQISAQAVFQGFRINIVPADTSPDFRLLAYGFGLSVVTGVIFGLAPALRFTRLDLNAAMKDEGSIFGPRFRRSRLRSLLLAVQVTVALPLLLLSGGLLNQFRLAATSSLGFESRHAYLVAYDGDYDVRRLRQRLDAVPEVAASAVGDMPLLGNGSRASLRAAQWNGPTFISNASDHYFETMAIRLARGREFTRQETADGAAVVVISEAAARRAWPHSDPLGRRLSISQENGKFSDYEVIGVAHDVHYNDISEPDALHVYLPTDGVKPHSEGRLVIRIRGNRDRALGAVQSAIGAADRRLLPSLQLIGMEEGPVALQRGFTRLATAIAGILTLLALSLASVGIYGVMAFLVGQRTREIGIRMALGANSRAIIRGVVIQGLRPVFFGMAAGFAAAVALDAWDRSTDLVPDTMLHSMFGDPIIYSEIVLMLAVALLASALPARRATQVDPMVALRHE